jgi:hypothetical protein
MPRFYGLIIHQGQTLLMEDNSLLKLNGGSTIDLYSGVNVNFKSGSTLAMESGSNFSGALTLTGAGNDLSLENTAALTVGDGSSISILTVSPISRLYLESTSQTWIKNGANVFAHNSSGSVGVRVSGGGGTGGRALLEVTDAEGEAAFRGSGGDITVSNGFMTVAVGAGLTVNGSFTVGGDMDLNSSQALNYSGVGKLWVQRVRLVQPNAGTDWDYHEDFTPGNQSGYWYTDTTSLGTYTLMVPVPAGATRVDEIGVKYWGGSWSSTPTNYASLRVAIVDGDDGKVKTASDWTDTETDPEDWSDRLVVDFTSTPQSVDPQDKIVIHVQNNWNAAESTGVFYLHEIYIVWRMGEVSPGL